jgi:hypothetical protein
MAVLSPTIGTMQNILTVNLTVKLKWCGEKPSVFKSLQVLSGSEFSLSGSINTLWDLNEMEAFGSGYADPIVRFNYPGYDCWIAPAEEAAGRRNKADAVLKAPSVRAELERAQGGARGANETRWLIWIPDSCLRRPAATGREGAPRTAMSRLPQHAIESHRAVLRRALEN